MTQTPKLSRLAVEDLPTLTRAGKPIPENANGPSLAADVLGKTLDCNAEFACDAVFLDARN